MNWIKLEQPDQLIEIQKQADNKQILIFKHSTRCSISRAALDRLERNWKEEEMKNVQPFFLDLISYRDLSNQIAIKFDVEHESPQVLVIKNGESIYDSSHLAIDYNAIKAVVQ